MTGLSCVEICAGAGGQSFGLEQAGFEHEAAVEIDRDACETLRLNRPDWHVIEKDVRRFDGLRYRGKTDLLAGGVPCPPFSIAGKQLGGDDERDLFPEMIRLAKEIEPAAVMIENVRGLAGKRFEPYLENLRVQFEDELKYKMDYRVLQAADYGVPQLRPRFILVAMSPEAFERFEWPTALQEIVTVGQALYPYMSEDGWEHAAEWSEYAASVAPTLVGGSRKHGGPDLGPTRARAQWKALGVDGRGLADRVPQPGDLHFLKDERGPRLTLRMAARVQGFSEGWSFSGRKTAAYRQIGNAFPPPVAEAVGKQISAALRPAVAKRASRSKLSVA